jgi:hypothetical protein
VRGEPVASALRLLAIALMIASMDWTTPSYEEVKMDAEIGSYQQDQQDDELPPFVESDAAE